MSDNTWDAPQLASGDLLTKSHTDHTGHTPPNPSVGCALPSVLDPSITGMNLTISKMKKLHKGSLEWQDTAITFLDAFCKFQHHYSVYQVNN